MNEIKKDNTEEKILNGIQNRAAYAKRHHWWEAREVAIPILEGLRQLPQVDRAETAGSLRRLKETVGDLDFIVASSNPERVMEWFTSLDEIQEITAKGTTFLIWEGIYRGAILSITPRSIPPKIAPGMLPQPPSIAASPTA